jgi:hypothetical protein
MDILQCTSPRRSPNPPVDVGEYVAGLDRHLHFQVHHHSDQPILEIFGELLQVGHHRRVLVDGEQDRHAEETDLGKLKKGCREFTITVSDLINLIILICSFVIFNL